MGSLFPKKKTTTYFTFFFLNVSLTNILTRQTYSSFLIILTSYSSNGDLFCAFVLKTITLVGTWLFVSSLILFLIRTAEYRSQ
jgi:hypothetical protein